MIDATNNGIKNFTEYIETLPETKKNGYIKFANGIYKSIQRNFDKYKEYNLNLNNQVNKMIEEGKVRKVK